MSRRRDARRADSPSAGEPPAPAAPATAPFDVPTPAEPVDGLTIRRRWQMAVGVTIAWLVFLTILAATTANPVTLNRVQLEESSTVMRGRIVDLVQGTVELDPTWERNGVESAVSITVKNLQATEAKNGGDYLIPVTRRGSDEVAVTPSRASGSRLLVYPATPEVIAAVEEILSARRK